MANPNPYTPSYSFSGWQSANPAKPLPAPQVDNELANISTSLNDAISALNQIRRSDGKLVNQIVTFESLDNDLRAGYSGGAVSAWAAVVDFAAGINATPIAPATVVVYQGETYVCTVAHVTTALFDVAKWKKIAARGINGTGSGDMLASLNLSDLANKPQARINLGIGNVDNTHDVDKPISTATQAAIDATNMAVAAVTANVALLDWFVGCVPAYVSTTSASFSSGTGFFGGKKHVLPAYTKLLNANFAAGNNAGMLDTGAIGASKTYFLHAIRNVSTGDCDYLASLSLAAPTVPAGWELNSGARVGALITNLSSQIVIFVQRGNKVSVLPLLWFSTNVDVAPALAVAANIPIGISLDVSILLTTSASGASVDAFASISDADIVNPLLAGNSGSGVTSRSRTGSGDNIDQSQAAGFARSNAAGQVARYVDHSSTGGTTQVYTQGWIDYTCKRLWG